MHCLSDFLPLKEACTDTAVCRNRSHPALLVALGVHGCTIGALCEYFLRHRAR